jgi:hypothetical protein
MIEVVPLQAQTLYRDLVDAHVLRPTRAETGGAPFRRMLRGRGYWYASERVGGRVVQRYLGPDDDATAERLARIGEERDDHQRFERTAADMVAQLRAARLPALDARTGALAIGLARAGVFDMGATLVGTHAFRLYDAELGRRVTAAAPASTEDLDIASFSRLSVALADAPGNAIDLGAVLAAHQVEPAPALDPGGRATRWRHRGGGAALDVLSPCFDATEGLVRLDALGAWARGLHFLDYLIADPIPAVALHRSGALVRVPRPERFAIHKLIVAHRRRGDEVAKRRKDEAQARALIVALAEDRPSELARAHEEARERGPAWRAAIDATLARLPEAARALASV